MTRKRKGQRPSESETEAAVEEGTSGEDQTRSAEDETSLEDQLKAAQTEAKENYERLLRATAEFENYKKRSQREMEDFRRFANERLIKEILPIVDNLERALSAEPVEGDTAAEGLREGVRMTLGGLTDTLKGFGVTPIESEGKPFDPNLHQAVSQEKSERFEDNTVSRELQKGYMLNDRLLRPSMVVVSRRPETAGSERPCGT